MAKIFARKNYDVSKLLLPYSEFRLFLDMESPSIDKDKGLQVVEMAEKMLDEEIPFLPLSLYRDFFITGNRANFESKNFKRRSMCYTLAIAEAFEKKGRFTDKLIDVIWAILEESTWILPAHTVHSPTIPGTEVPEVYGTDMMHGIDLFSESTCAMLTTVYLLLKDTLDAVSPYISERLAYELYNRSTRPFMHLQFSWSGKYGNRPNNWNPWIVSNVLYTTAIMEKDDAKRAHIVKKCIEYLDYFINGYAEDGGCDEGPAYWGCAGGSLFDCLEILYDLSGGKIDIFDEPLIRAIGEYESKFNIHYDRFVNFADSHGRIISSGNLLTRFGKRCGSESLEAFGYVMAQGGRLCWDHNLGYRSYKNLCTPIVYDAPPTKAEKKVYFPNLKVMISRESEETNKGMFVAMKGGHNGESHNHNDVGNFIVYYNGNPVIIDAGVGVYTRQTFSPQRYELWFMQSNYHNLPTFDGVGEMQGGIYSSTNEEYDPETGEYAVNLEGAYTKQTGVKYYRRSAVLEGSRVTVTDSITLDREQEINFHLLTCVAPVLNNDGTISLPEGRTLRYDPRLEAKIEEFEATGMAAKSNWGTKNLWRIHLRTRTTEFEGKIIIE